MTEVREHGADGVGRGAARERRTSGQQLAEHGAQREEVGARVEHFAPQLLRGRIADGTRKGAVSGLESGFGLRPLGNDRCPGNAEVEDFEDALVRQKRFAGLRSQWITALEWAAASALRNLARISSHGGGATDRPGERLRQRLTFEILHDQESQAALLADVVERADVRMVVCGDRAGLPFDQRQTRWPAHWRRRAAP